MTVSRITETWRGSDSNLEGEERQYTRVFQVFYTPITLGNNSILTQARQVWDAVTPTSPFPKYNDPYPEDSQSFAKTFTVERSDSNPCEATITVQYTTEEDDSNTRTYVTWTGASITKPFYEEPPFVDAPPDPKKVVNSAGDPFTPLPTRNVTQIRFSVVSFHTSIDPTWLFYMNTLNLEDITVEGQTFTAKTVLCTAMSIPKEELSGDVYRRRVTASFAYDPEGWETRLLDAGFREIDPADATKRIPIRDNSKPPDKVSSPWPLDGTGKKVVNPGVDNVTILPFRKYPSVTWADLPGLSDVTDPWVGGSAALGGPAPLGGGETGD